MKRSRLSRGQSKVRPVRMMRSMNYPQAVEVVVRDMKSMEVNIFQLSSVLSRLYGKDRDAVFEDIANEYARQHGLKARM